MQTHSLLNKTTLMMITGASGKEVQPMNLSIQKAMLKPNGEYDVTCIAAIDKNAINDNRHGQFKVKEDKGDKFVIDVEEETGAYSGHYEVVFQWLDNHNGTWMSKN